MKLNLYLSSLILLIPSIPVGYMCVGVCLGWGFEAALITTTVWEQQPRSHHKGATSMQTHQAVRVGFELASNG